jgi:hypothetical protein
VAIDEGTTGAVDPRPEDPSTFSGFTGRSSMGGSGGGGGTSSRTAPAVPSPAVPLVPPVRSTPRPTAPVDRTTGSTGTSARSSNGPTTVDRAGVTGATPVVVAPVINPTTTGPQSAVAPSPPAPARVRPPVRTRMARRPRVRKVNRVVRRIDAWSVFKIALVFWVVVVAILLVAGMLLWNLASTTGTITNIEGFVKDLFGLKTFQLNGGQILRSAWIIGGVVVIAGTALTVTMTVLFNLIADLLGGIRVTVLEEEVILRLPPTTGQVNAVESQNVAGPTPVGRRR